MYKEGDMVRIIAKDDSEYNRVCPVHGMSGDHTVWVNVGFGMAWRYRPDEVEAITNNNEGE
jgi:hypothetical protein